MDITKLSNVEVVEIWDDGSVLLNQPPFSTGDQVMLEWWELEALYLAAKEKRDAS